MLLCALPSSSMAGNHQVTGTSSLFEKTYTVVFSTDSLLFDRVNGYDTVRMDECGFTMDVGKPQMPCKEIRIAVPTEIQITNIHVDHIEEQTMDGSFLLIPTQHPQTIDEILNTEQFVQPDPQVYQSNHPYPGSSVEILNQNDMAGQCIVSLMMYPLQYFPVQMKITTMTSITFTLEGVPGYICGDYLPAHCSDNSRLMYIQMVQNMVINPEDVTLQSSPSPQPSGVEPGNYEYVIITQESWVTDFQPLKDWKTQKGVPATIVTTNWIYTSGGYSGTDVEKIRAFVQDAYTNWGATFFLLGGDVDVVPCHYKTISTVDPDPIANDAYFADFDADWVCEVNVGRAPVSGPGNGTAQIGNFIYKVLTYEKNPPLTNYAKKAGFFGFDLDGNTHAEQCKINIKNAYIPASWTMTTVYDSQQGNHKTNVIDAINAGQNLMNHADHSGPFYMGTGYINHDLGLENDDMDALTNGNKQGILYSMGCDPAAYDEDDCIGEHFVQNNNGGGVAFIGNSRYGWYYSGSYDTLSMGYDVEFFKSIFQDNLYHLGAAFSNHKNDGVSNDAWSKYCFTELTLIGDPELPIWKEDPISMTASHLTQIPVGMTSFEVTVTSNGNPVNQAYVCLWKGSEVYLTGTTNSAGVIAFTLPSLSSGAMSVTVTKQNYLPYVGMVMVGEGVPFLSIETVNGGLLAVTADIKNIGQASAQNVQWGITIDGGFMFSGQTLSGTISSLNGGSSSRIENAPVLGFGSVHITVTAYADGVPEITKTVDGFVLLIYVIVS
jgi:hypothetical protein